MTPEQYHKYEIARTGIINRIAEMEKNLELIKAWVLYGEMEKMGGKSAAISEEKVTLDNF